MADLQIKSSLIVTDYLPAVLRYALCVCVCVCVGVCGGRGGEELIVITTLMHNINELEASS